MDREALNQELINDGWQVDESFSRHLLMAHSGALSIVVPERVWQDEVPLYELYDVEKNIGCWAWSRPTPLRAKMLLEEFGNPVHRAWIPPGSTHLKPELR